MNTLVIEHGILPTNTIEVRTETLPGIGPIICGIRSQGNELLQYEELPCRGWLYKRIMMYLLKGKLKHSMLTGDIALPRFSIKKYTSRGSVYWMCRWRGDRYNQFPISSIAMSPSRYGEVVVLHVLTRFAKMVEMVVDNTLPWKGYKFNQSIAYLRHFIECKNKIGNSNKPITQEDILGLLQALNCAEQFILRE